MGLITGSKASKVLTSSESVGRATVIQPGSRIWTTVIECINAMGWALPPFVIVEGKVHIDYWYDQPGLPRDWAVGVSDNGWTNDSLGYKWIQHFDKFTKDRCVGTYRLLILDGHGSHATPEFDLFCSQNHIIALCLPSHTSHILQPLDVACFGPLKQAYGQLVQNLARISKFHVDKADFLAMYQQARSAIHSASNIQSAFRATGLIPFNPDCVLSMLTKTPTPPSTSHGMLNSSPWASETPRNLADLAKQARLLQTTIDRTSQSPTEPLAKVIKGCELALSGAILQEIRIKELEAALAEKQLRKRRSRRYLQHGGVLEIGEAQDQILARNTQEAA